MTHTYTQKNSAQNNRSFKNLTQNLMIFINLCFGSGRMFVVTIFSLVVTALVTLTIPVAFRYLIDQGLGNRLDSGQIILFGVLVLMLALGTALRYYSVTITGERVYNGLRTKIFKHLLSFSHYEFQSLEIGDILSRLMSDTEIIREFTGSSLSIAGRNILLLCGGLAMMLYTNLFLTLMALLIIPLVLIPIILIGKSLKVLSKESLVKLSDSNLILNETLYALSTVQNFTQENYCFERFKTIADTTYMVAKRRILKRALLTFCIIALVFGAVLSLLIYGSIAVKNGTMSAGEFTQFVLYSVFTAGAAAALSEVLGGTYKVKATYDRLNDLLTIEPRIKNTDNPMPLKKFDTICFDKVGVKYDNRTVASLDDISLEIKQGQKIAFVGLSGAGKSTLLKLFLREINATTGKILWNNHAIEDYDITKIRQEITYVSQSITLFSGSIADNIRFGNPNATIRDIIKAASDAQLHSDIMALPNGYDSMIGERGFELSGGQRQRLAIARGLLKNASIWILDEPTAALDSETESKFLKTLSDLTHDKTVVTVTHRLATLSQMDMIYVLEKGHIIEQGTHSQLWDNQGSRYRQFIDFQSV
jgi:ATP-binding cassette, subfamily B, bacterial